MLPFDLFGEIPKEETIATMKANAEKEAAQLQASTKLEVGKKATTKPTSGLQAKNVTSKRK